MIGPNNQLPRRRAGRGGLQSSSFDMEEDFYEDNIRMTSSRFDNQKHLSQIEEIPEVSEAVSLFPHPKSLLTRVIQVAVSSNRVRVCS